MKKYALVFLSVFLFISAPFAAHANIVTATGKYLINAVKHVPGAVRVDATNTATGAKHVIKHGISSADLGKSIGAGIVGFGVGTGAGFAFKAITGLALDAVDWVMDPANNAIRYTVPAVPAAGEIPAPVGKGWVITGVDDGRYFASNIAAAKYSCANYSGSYSKFDRLEGSIVYCKNSAGESQYAGSVNVDIKPANKPLLGSAPPTKKSIPLNTLAQKILELADAGNAAAQKDVETHVAHKAQNGDLDNELDNAPDITQPENPEEPNPEEPQECPSGSVKVDDVCVKIPDSDGDEPLFCDSSEFTKKVCDWIDWTQTEHDEPEPDSGKVDIKDKSEDLSIDNDRIDFSNQCPAPTPINTSVGGFPVSTELNYQPLCDFFTMLNPFVIGMGGISSALIIAGGARRG